MAQSTPNLANLIPRNTLWGRPWAGNRIQQARAVTDIPVARLPEALNAAPLRDLFEAWRRAAEAEGTTPPSRAQFHPQDVRSILGRTMIADREPVAPSPETDGADWTCRYRLVGTEIVAIFGQDFTGQTLEVFHPPLRAMVRAQFDAAFARSAPVAMRIQSVVDHLAYDYEKLVLPVRSAAGGAVDQAVVATIHMPSRKA